HTRFSRDWSSDVCSSDLIGHSPGSLPTPDRVLTEHVVRYHFLRNLSFVLPPYRIRTNNILFDRRGMWPQKSRSKSGPAFYFRERSEERRVGKEGGIGRYT